MKLDRNIINKEITEEKKENFINYIHNKINFQAPTKFKWYITSIYGYLTGIIMFLFAIMFFWFLFVNFLNFFESKFYLYAFGAVASTLITVLWIIALFRTRRSIIDESLSHLDLMDLTKKWFSYYKVDKNNIYTEELYPIKIINEFKQAPKDANIDNISPSLTIEHNSIKTSIVNVLWHWTTTKKDKDGKEKIRHHYLNQLYSFDTGFASKWSDFQFHIKKGKNFFNKKHKTLENNDFNKSFNYSYNDPIKLRMLFTPSVQENVLKFISSSKVTICKKNNFVITTCKTNHIFYEWNLLNLEEGLKNIHFRLNENHIKDSVCVKLLSNYQLLMKFMGYARILYTLYE